MVAQLLQIGIAGFAAVCAVMVIRTVVEVLPELLALQDSEPRRGEPVPVPIARHEPLRPRRSY